MIKRKNLIVASEDHNPASTLSYDAGKLMIVRLLIYITFTEIGARNGFYAGAARWFLNRAHILMFVFV